MMKLNIYIEDDDAEDIHKIIIIIIISLLFHFILLNSIKQVIFCV